MKRKGITAAVAIALGFLLFYQYYGGGDIPDGQPPLVRLNDSNLSGLRESFNQSAKSVRLLVMLSPT